MKFKSQSQRKAVMAKYALSFRVTPYSNITTVKQLQDMRFKTKTKAQQTISQLRLRNARVVLVDE